MFTPSAAGLVDTGAGACAAPWPEARLKLTGGGLAGLELAGDPCDSWSRNKLDGSLDRPVGKIMLDVWNFVI